MKQFTLLHRPQLTPSILASILLTGLLLLPLQMSRAQSGRAVFQAPAAAASSGQETGAANLDSENAESLIFWHNHSGSRQAALDGLIAEFNETNPQGIQVQGQFMGGYRDIEIAVISALRQGSALPNLVSAYPNAMAEFARYDGVRFLDDYLADATVGITDTADFHPGVLDYYRLVEFQGHLAGLQHGRSIEVMFYNADLLAQESLGVPQSWGEFQAAAAAVTQNEVIGAVLNLDPSRFATWLWSRGGELISADGRQSRFQEAPGIQSLCLFQELFAADQARLQSGQFEDQAAFGQGRTAFTFSSSAGIPFYRSAMEGGANQSWGVARIPADAGHEVVNSYGAGIGILRHDETADRYAWLFLKWLTHREQTARWAASGGYFPVRISAQSHISMTQKLASDSQYAQAAALLPLGKIEPTIRTYNGVRALLQEAMVATLQNGAEVTQTLQTAAAEADRIIGEAAPVSQVIPQGGGTLTYTNPSGGGVSVRFPPAVLTQEQTVSIVPLQDLPTPGIAFALVPDLLFSQPVTISITYGDGDVGEMDEAALGLYTYDWPQQRWVAAAPCGPILREPEENRVQFGVCHFSDYGLLDYPFRVHLPALLRDW